MVTNVSWVTISGPFHPPASDLSMRCTVAVEGRARVSYLHTENVAASWPPLNAGLAFERALVDVRVRAAEPVTELSQLCWMDVWPL